MGNPHWASFISHTLSPSWGPKLALVATQRCEAPAWAHLFSSNRFEKTVCICPGGGKKIVLIWQTLFEKSVLSPREVAALFGEAEAVVWKSGDRLVPVVCQPEKATENLNSDTLSCTW